jgi:hypothetical protein
MLKIEEIFFLRKSTDLGLTNNVANEMTNNNKL